VNFKLDSSNFSNDRLAKNVLMKSPIVTPQCHQLQLRCSACFWRSWILQYKVT